MKDSEISQSQNQEKSKLTGPSVVVSLSGFYFRRYEGLLDELNIGDHLRFNATLINMGN